jgi:chromosome segregation ATPase
MSTKRFTDEEIYKVLDEAVNLRTDEYDRHGTRTLAHLVLEARAERAQAIAAAQANGHTPSKALQRLTNKLRDAELCERLMRQELEMTRQHVENIRGTPESSLVRELRAERDELQAENERLAQSLVRADLRIGSMEADVPIHRLDGAIEALEWALNIQFNGAPFGSIYERIEELKAEKGKL